MLQMQENGFYWVGNRIYGPDLRYRADQPDKNKKIPLSERQRSFWKVGRKFA